MANIIVKSEKVRNSEGYVLTLKSDQVEKILSYVNRTFIETPTATKQLKLLAIHETEANVFSADWISPSTLRIDSGDASEFIN